MPRSVWANYTFHKSDPNWTAATTVKDLDFGEQSSHTFTRWNKNKCFSLGWLTFIMALPPTRSAYCLSLCLFFFCLVASSLSLSSRVAPSLSLGPACLSLGNKEKMPAMRWNWNAAKARNIIIQTGRGALRMGDIKGGGSLLAWIINASKILIACTWNEFQTTTSDVGQCRSHMTNDWHADWAGDKSTPPTHYQPNPQPTTHKPPVTAHSPLPPLWCLLPAHWPEGGLFFVGSTSGCCINFLSGWEKRQSGVL